MKQFLIINADDFGMSSRVNAAVVRAHRDGILTSASLMVAEDGWQEAVTLAKQNPRLGVGLHTAITVDKSLLPHTAIPHITDAGGRFGADPLRVGLRYAFLKTAQAELRREMTAQFERFAETGLEWSHADGHQHFHLHPAAWDIFLDLCDQFGVHRIRVPYEPLISHFRPKREIQNPKRKPHDLKPDPPNLDTIGTLFLRLLRRRALRTLRERNPLGGKPVFLCDRVYGMLQSSRMHSAYWLTLLDRLEGRTVEIYTHPGTDYAQRLPNAAPSADITDVELAALLDPAVRVRLAEHNIFTGNYAEIEAAARKTGEFD